MATAEHQQTRPAPTAAPRPLRAVHGHELPMDVRAPAAQTSGHEFGMVPVRSAGMAGGPMLPSDDQTSHAVIPSPLERVVTSPGEALPASVRAIVEPRFGRSFDGIRIHTDRDAATASLDLDANAWTFGHHIAFGAGRFDPASRRGMWLLSHELAHTIQQDGMGPLQRPVLASAPDAGDQAADLAADAVMTQRPVPSQPRWQGIQRQRVTSIDVVNEDEKVAHLDNGTRLRVKRVRWVTTTTDLRNWGRLTPGIDAKDIWLDIDWCAGQNRGNVELRANIPGELLKTILENVKSGGDIDTVLRGRSLTPVISTTIIQSGSFTITAGGQVTITPTGVTGGGGRIGVSTGPFDFGVEGSGSQGGGAQVTGTVTITPGRRTPQQECRIQKTRLVQNTRYECTSEREVAGPPVTVQVPVTDHRQRFVYFEHARDVLSARSASTTTDLSGDLRDGFKVDRIRGFTSPEGPQAPGRGFMGNKELARRRAAAASRVVEAACRTTGGSDPDACFLGGRDAVSPTGEGELYTLTTVDSTGATREVEGAPLAEHASERFLAEEAEASHRTPEIEARLNNPSTSPAERADIVYPLLRRAEISLVRSRTVPQTRPGPSQTQATQTSCPDDVIERLFPRAGQVPIR